MTLVGRGARRAGFVDPVTWKSIASQTLTVAEFESLKMLREPVEMVTRSIQPILWLLVFGTVFQRSAGLAPPGSTVTYVQFIAPGVIAQSVMFTSIYYGIAVIWERDVGLVQKLLASPAERVALVAGRALAAGVRGLGQGSIVVVLAVVLGLHVQVSPVSLVLIALLIVLAGMLFGTLSLVIACVAKTRERFLGLGQIITMPLFFGSNAIYPLEIMPSWLRVVARANPLTYVVAGLRELMLGERAVLGSGPGLATDFALLIGTVVILISAGSAVYPRVVQ